MLSENAAGGGVVTPNFEVVQETHIFSSMTNWATVGVLSAGDMVQSDGPVMLYDGHWMLPILPLGVVDIKTPLKDAAANRYLQCCTAPGEIRHTNQIRAIAMRDLTVCYESVRSAVTWRRS